MLIIMTHTLTQQPRGCHDLDLTNPSSHAERWSFYFFRGNLASIPAASGLKKRLNNMPLGHDITGIAALEASAPALTFPLPRQ